jgi:hypothetical protein
MFTVYHSFVMSTHSRLAKRILVYCMAHTWLVPTPYVNVDMSSPRSSWIASYQRNFLVIAHIRENTIIWYLIRDYLIFATIVYLDTSKNKIHTITSNVNNVWYDMVLHRRASLISIECFGMISIFPPVWHQVHGAIIVKVLLVSHNLPYHPYHVTSPHCKAKLDGSTFILLHILRGCYGFHTRIVSYLWTSSHNIDRLIIYLSAR